MTKPHESSQGRWMYAVAVIAFLVLFVLLVRWMHVLGVFNQTVSFRYAALGVFLFCAAVVLINIVGRIPALLRWISARLSRSA